MISIDLSQQVVLITGGSRGIGAAAARLFARAGADVAILYSSSLSAARSLSDEIEGLGRRALIVKANVAQFSECKKAVQRVRDQFGSIDHLINSAGIWEYGPIDKISNAEWQRTVDVNLTGTFNACRAVVPIMKKQRSGSIVNVASTAGQRGEALHSHYAASKGGIIAFTKSIAAELMGAGIRVNCVAPGWVNTEMVAHVFKEPSEKRKIVQSIPRGRIATAEEIASPILFLSSKMADHIVGEVLNVNGGSVMCG
jgi:3-oxoacyl-[acyl-carrier protein] reductase